jgi:excisionase family DNA binding protein
MHNTKPNASATTRPANVYRNVDELARELGLGRLTVYGALRDGTIPSIRVGRRYLLPRAAIQEWLRSAGGRLSVIA